jgi:PEGA domain
MNTATLRDETPPGTALPELVARARAAYDQKRTKECVELTKQVLLADIDNVEAKALQAAVRADIQRDLTDARALLEDAGKNADGQKFRKAAEIILLKILYLDPSHEEAKSLLSGSKSTVVRPRRLVEEEIAFTAQPEPIQIGPPARSRINLKVPLIAAGIVLLAGGVWLFRSFATGNVPEPSEARVVVPPVPAPRNTASAVIPTPPSPPVIEVKAVVNSAALPPLPAKEPAVPTVANSPEKVAAVKETGSLAINSPTAADIYMGDKNLGSTPITLQLPAGRQTLEYRHGDLRTVMTHDVKARETTAVFVTFEITVQLNARPWAQVFVEGSTRRALGQTPLSSVRVPIGSVLTFENPNFPPKSHRILESDTAIQMVFP